MQTIVIGCGTGRCGTVSLAALLNEQWNANVTHEARPLLPWYSKGMETPLLLQKKILGFIQAEGEIAGDVAFSWLPYIGDLRWYAERFHLDYRVVCLVRAREDTIESYIRKVGHRGVNHWMVNDGSWTDDPEWDPCYPKFEAPDMRTAIGMYWDSYYQEALRIQNLVPRHFRLWKMEDALNTELGVREILDFIGIPRERQVVRVGLRLNWTTRAARGEA